MSRPIYLMQTSPATFAVLGPTYTMTSQTFLGFGGKLSSASFLLDFVNGSPVGNSITCTVYAANGISFPSGVPTGSVIATSETSYTDTQVDNGGKQLYTFNFTGDDAITLERNTPYAIVLNYTYVDTYGMFAVYLENDHATLSPSFGNYAEYYSGTWYPNTSLLCGSISCSDLKEVTSGLPVSLANL